MDQVWNDLRKLAFDQSRASNARANELWSRVNPDLWNMTRNSWLIMQITPREQFSQLAEDQEFMQILENHMRVEKDLLEGPCWFNGKLSSVAYFSMEFGLSEALPIYSGGLGILAGDHLKSASDLGVPVVGIGILYQQGYFRQDFDRKGRQTELFPYNEPSQLPISRVLREDGRGLRISIPLPGRDLWLRAWEVQVGRCKLYLLDSNDPLNSPADRGITAELYGGNEEMRLKQEIVLGIGGWHLIEALGIKPEICHLNEGHAALAALARMHSLNLSIEAVRAGTLFTTHTPVVAGFDNFPESLVHQYLPQYLEDLKTLGQEDGLNMAFLAARLSSSINGVSKLHGEVSRELFPKDISIGYVTNGIHVPSWESPEADRLWTEACGEERWKGDLATLEKDFRCVPDEKLLNFRRQAKEKLINYLHERLRKQCKCSGKDEEELLFDPDALILGFARRFASYKRVTMLLKDPDRLARLLTSKERPVYLCLAGKAHPADSEGKKMVEQWNQFCMRPDIKGRVIFLADYDILLAERLVQSVDLWINTPLRPYEASGTSGMKVLANGGLNLSVLDGWWPEAYSSDVGWAISGKGDDAEELFVLLEEQVVPLFYRPAEWLAMVRESMARLTPKFSTNRMVREYTERFYIPAAEEYRTALKKSEVKSGRP